MAPGRIAGESRLFEGNFPESALEHDRKGVEHAEARVPYGQMRLEQSSLAVEHAEARRKLGRSQVPYGAMRLEQSFRAVDYDFWAVEQARDGLEQSGFNNLRATILLPHTTRRPGLGRQPAVACLAAGAGAGTG